MGIIRGKKPITDSDIPAAIARDAEITAEITAHVTDLHQTSPTYGFGQVISTEDVFDYGSGFLDCRDGGGTFPPGMGHIQGFQARFFYTAAKWGMQLVTQNNIDNECYFRTVKENIWGAWRRIWNDGNFNPSDYSSRVQSAAAMNTHVTDFHSVRCSIIRTTVAAVGVESFVGIGTIPPGKIVGINAYILDNLGVSGINYIFRGGGGDFNPNPTLVSGTIRIGGVSASQLVEKPLHFLIWHLP